jgi:ABC-type antimicrobial peptide transport system permease subunit
MRFLVRTTAADPLQLVPAIRSRVATVEPDEPLFDAFSMKQILYEDIASEYVLSVVFTAIAIIALAVAAVGVYGLVAHDVTQRTREIGLRLALGAAPASVIRMVLSDGTRPVLYGGVVGLAAAVALAFATAATFLGNARESDRLPGRGRHGLIRGARRQLHAGAPRQPDRPGARAARRVGDFDVRRVPAGHSSRPPARSGAVLSSPAWRRCRWRSV